MKKSRRRLYMIIAVVGVLLMWSYCGTDADVSKDGRGGMTHLLDRPWVTKLPKNPKEPSHALVFLKKDNIGASVNGSAYQHLVTVLRHKVKGNKLTVEVLQAGKTFTTLGKTYKCDGPGKLDLCLDLGPRVKQLRLYSSSKWRIGEEGTPSFGLDTIDGVSVSETDTKLEAIDETVGMDLIFGR